MDAYLPWISAGFGLVGAVIGASASIITVWIQSRVQDRRAALNQTAQLTLADYTLRMEMAPDGFEPFKVRFSISIGEDGKAYVHLLGTGN
jgi:hypothetical protein